MFCRFNKITHSLEYYVAKKCALECALRSNSSCATILQYRNIPSPKGLPLIGTTLALIAEGAAPRLHIYADKRHKQLGPIFKDKIGTISAIFLSDPELMRSVFTQEGKCPVHLLPEAWSLYNDIYGCSRGLFFMNGEEWIRNRRILNNILLKGDSEWIKRACEAVSLDIINRWELLTRQTLILPHLETELYNWSLKTIVAVLLGENCFRMHKCSFNSVLQELSPIVESIFETSVPFQVMPAKLAYKLNLPSWNRFVKTVDQALKISKNLVTKLVSDYPESDGLLTKLKAENLPHSIILRIVIDLVLAAGDTTAYTMSWILYSLAKHKNIQNDLRRSDSYKHVIRETLRLYPVAPFLTRILPHDSIVGGYEIPAGTLMLYSIYTSGRNPNFFNDPDTFCPNRWLRENCNSVMQQACIPFGFGARSCIGKRIAEYQLNALVTDLLSNFNLDLDNKKDIEMVLKMIAVPSQPIRLTLNKI